MKPVLCLLLLAIGLPARSQDLSLYQKRAFTSPAGQALPYRILLPENYDQTRT